MHQKPIKRIYKFFDSRHLAALMDVGSIRIGTLAEFRLPDGIEDGRSDLNEGRRVWAPPQGAQSLVYDHPLRRILSPFECGVVPPIIHFEEGAKIVNLTDANVFCASSKITALMTQRMRTRFGYDMAYSVIDVPEFFRAILNADSRLSSRAADDGLGDCGVSKVRYVDVPDETGYFRNNDPFEKDQAYRWQQEVRALFMGDGPHQPMLLEVPEIPRLVKLVRLD